MSPPTDPRLMTLDRILGSTALDPVIAILAAIAFVIGGHGDPDTLPTIVGIALPIVLIRRWPLAGFALISIATVATRGAGGWLDVAVFVAAAASVGAGIRRVEPSLALVVIDSALMGVGFVRLHAEAWTVFAPVLLAVPGWLAGDMIRMRRLAVLEAAILAAEQARRREATLREAAREERRHMARELHDIIAHSVSVMVIQAGAARQVVENDPHRATESLLAIEATGREAMTELRRIVGVLGEEGEGVDLAPQPGVAQLDSLVERVADAGLPIEFRIEGEPRP
ncbi:MAG TPA: histidine kinase dimerization/phosphoacceptor domain-containing protein, partial [Candidatus Acidoferrum sp.]|nr:histidine kinase dimerization/phosphoacceptor domain-containing protein [Candidatus Acidoferrum sp.]